MRLRQTVLAVSGDLAEDVDVVGQHGWAFRSFGKANMRSADDVALTSP
jgi:hypothetical protein